MKRSSNVALPALDAFPSVEVWPALKSQIDTATAVSIKGWLPDTGEESRSTYKTYTPTGQGLRAETQLGSGTRGRVPELSGVSTTTDDGRSTSSSSTPTGRRGSSAPSTAAPAGPQSGGPGSCKVDVPTVFLESSCIVRGPGLPAVNRLGSQVSCATKQQHTTQASPECQRHGSPVVQPKHKTL